MTAEFEYFRRIFNTELKCIVVFFLELHFHTFWSDLIEHSQFVSKNFNIYFDILHFWEIFISIKLNIKQHKNYWEIEKKIHKICLFANAEWIIQKIIIFNTPLIRTRVLLSGDSANSIIISSMPKITAAIFCSKCLRLLASNVNYHEVYALWWKRNKIH